MVILAAGEGKRMRSATPKVLHTVAGKPMLAHVLSAAAGLKAGLEENLEENLDIHIVYGHAGDQVRAGIAPVDGVSINWVHQAEQLGTGHAVAQALSEIPNDIPDTHSLLILCADVPLITTATLVRLVQAAEPSGALLSVCLDNPQGYGRVLRSPEVRSPDIHSFLTAVIEDRDANEAQRAVNEVNTGVMCLPTKALKRWLSQLDTNNTQGEYYLTDCVAMAHLEGHPLTAVCTDNPLEVQGVNDRAQLAVVERAYQKRMAQRFMRDEGLALADPQRFDLRGNLSVGRDCFIDLDVILEGDVTLGDGVRIGPFCRIRDTHIEAGAEIDAYCDIRDTHISTGCHVGPFARLRPGTFLSENARVGNFVETKKVRVGPGSKINHLSYIGDASIGAGVNIGAGTITCNYDGTRKHDTHIGDRAFIGSNTALVAPIKVGERATVGAGSTLRKNVPPDTLAVTNKDTHHVHGWSGRSKTPKPE